MDAVLRALADPTRRRILVLVRDRERTVTEIAEHFDVTRPAISQHLRVLRDAELLEVRQEGTSRLHRTRVETVDALLRELGALWDVRLDRLRAAAEDDEMRDQGDRSTT